MRKAVVILGAWLMAGPAFAETSIRAVTLSTAGVAMIAATGAMDSNGLTLPIRRADIDDFLKSLRLSDPAGGVPALTLTGPGGIADTFAALPFGPEELTDLRALLNAMTGAPVTVTRRGIAQDGVLMGTRDVTCAGDGAKACVALALRGADDTLRQIALDEGTEVAFVDPADRAAMDRGLAALRGAARADQLAVRLTSTATDPREVTLGWLQPAPVWKTAWRAEETDAGLVLTGWAVIENTSGQDWDQIELTLATGAVQALEAQLYNRVEAARKLATPQLEPMLATAPMAARSMAFESAMDMTPVGMETSDSFSSFSLTTPVSLAAGDMLSLPFLQQTLPDARLTLYRGGSGDAHPSIALDFENPLPLRLPAGVLTLYATAGHAGDAMVPELASGARARLEFATDNAVSVHEDRRDDARLVSARIVDGVLVAQEQLEARTTYHLEGAATDARVVTLLHPVRSGWQATGTDWQPDGLHHLRRDVALAAGSMEQAEIVETYVTGTRMALIDMDTTALAYWSSRLPDDATRITLTRLQDLRTQISALDDTRLRLGAKEGTLIADQQRLVSLIVQLGDDSAANTDRRARVDAIDAEITANRAARAQAEQDIAALQDQIRALLR
jgi:hypothetical protein